MTHVTSVMTAVDVIVPKIEARWLCIINNETETKKRRNI